MKIKIRKGNDSRLYTNICLGCEEGPTNPGAGESGLHPVQAGHAAQHTQLPACRRRRNDAAVSAADDDGGTAASAAVDRGASSASDVVGGTKRAAARSRFECR